MANMASDEATLRYHVRRATRADAPAIHGLLQNGTHVHLHADWHTPGDWLGTPGFVVCEPEMSSASSSHATGVDASRIAGCLAVAADPAPAAWVRIAALRSANGFDQLRAMFADVVAELPGDLSEIAWFLSDHWPAYWLDRLGFVWVNDVVSYRKDDFDVPDVKARVELHIRPVAKSDFPRLAAIEEAAFEPRWRHSAEALYFAWRQSYSFDVATLDGKPVGFQFSTRGSSGPHLARMTVTPEWQGQGIGASLLAHAIAAYRRHTLLPITLNTQADNTPSRRLYERFGFRTTGDVYAVLTYWLQQDSYGTQKA